MKIKFDKIAFLDATKWALDVVDVKNDTATIRMTVDPEASIVTFSASSMLGERSIDVTADVKVTEKDGEITPFELLASAVKKLPAQVTSDEIEFTYNDNNKNSRTRIIANVGLKLDLPVLSSQDRPVHDVSKMTEVGTLVPADLFHVVSKLAVIPDQSSSDSRFSSLDFKTDGKGDLTVMAMDGFTMSTRKIKYDAVEGVDEQRFLLQASDVTKMSAGSASTAVTIYTDRSAVAFVFDDGRVSRVNKLQMEPIQYDGLVFDKRDGEQFFDFKVKELSDAVSRLSSWTIDDDVFLDVDPSDQLIIVHSKTNDWQAEVPLDAAEMGEDEQELHVAFPKPVITKVLRTADSEVLQAKFVRAYDGETAASSDRAYVFNQLKGDGSTDDTVYIMGLPTTENAI